ncbi:hypothetical protein [Nostoc sp.]|uniref:hypothetical protein n=1 Tax=Nostoc sp. TaxID=1180 RepID=UPI002FF05654
MRYEVWVIIYGREIKLHANSWRKGYYWFRDSDGMAHHVRPENIANIYVREVK